MGGQMRVEEIATADTYALRTAVLRDGDPTRSVRFPEDDLPGAMHLGVRDDTGDIVATSSWMPRQCPDFPDANAIQLRGMATATTLQGSGVGGLLIEEGVRRCAAAGFDLMWARARDAALAFYQRHDCRVVGDGFIDETTQLPHHIVVRELA